MLSYDQTMAAGADRYRDVLDLLADAGLSATFTQTGGMNAALEVLLDGGHTLLVTDVEDSLSWDREEHQGWGVGLYRPDQENTDGSAWRSTAPTTARPRPWSRWPAPFSPSTRAAHRA